MISACSSGAKVKIADIKYLASNKVFLISIERTKIETNQEDKKINVDMTLTTPNCPVAESLPKMVKDNIMKVEGVRDVALNGLQLLLLSVLRTLSVLFVGNSRILLL